MVKLLLDLRRATSHIPLGVRRFVEGDLLSVNLEEYPHSRADAAVWLGQLQGNSLVCDCKLRGLEECHAAIVERWSLSVDQTVLPSSGSTPAMEKSWMRYRRTIHRRQSGMCGRCPAPRCEPLRGAPASDPCFTEEWRR